MAKLQTFLEWLEAQDVKPIFTHPKQVMTEAALSCVKFGPVFGGPEAREETEEALRLRLRAHWPGADRAAVDVAIERRYHPERRG